MQSNLDHLRARIAYVSATITELLGVRHALSMDIGKEKQRLGIPIRDPEREATLIRHLVNWNTSRVPSELIEAVFKVIMEHSVAAQDQRTNRPNTG